MQSLLQLYYVLISLLFGVFIHFLYSLFFLKLKKFIATTQVLFYTSISIIYIRILEVNEIQFNKILILFIVLGYFISYLYLSYEIEKILTVFYKHLEYIYKILLK